MIPSLKRMDIDFDNLFSRMSARQEEFEKEFDKLSAIRTQICRALQPYVMQWTEPMYERLACAVKPHAVKDAAFSLH